MCLNKTFSWSINVLKSIFFPKKTLYPKRMIQCQAMMMMIMTISLHHRLSFFTSYFLGVALTLSLVWLVRIIQNQWKLIEWCQWKTLWKIIFHEKKKKQHLVFWKHSSRQSCGLVASLRFQMQLKLLSSRSLFVVKCKLEGMYVVVRSFRFHFV